MIGNSLKIVKVISQHDSRKIHGRLRLQKTIHILKHIGFDFTESFTYLHYGPYSYALYDEIQQSLSWNILEEEKGADEEYIYMVKDEGKELIQSFTDLIEGAKLPSDDIIRTLQNYDTPVLELLSTYYYLLECGRTEEDAWKELEELKPGRVQYRGRAENLDSELKKLRAKSRGQVEP